MKRILPCLAVTALLFVGAAVCTAQSGGPARASAAKAVEISNFKFQPATLNVSRGTRVTFSNSSNTAHTATDKGAFDTGRIKPGRSVAVRFERKGTFSYHCKIHPSMHGKIVVG